MSFEAEQDAIEARFIAAWVIAQPTIPVVYDNSSKAPPTSGSWIRFRIYDVDGTIIGVGGSSTLDRMDGFIEIVVNVEKGTGTKVARGLCDDAAGIFRNKDFSDITTKSAWPQRLGEIEGWWRYALTIEFERDESFT